MSDGTWDSLRGWIPGSKVDSIYVSHFKGIEEIYIGDWSQRGTYLLIGPNGSGKSTILDALKWLFIGGTEKETKSGHIPPSEEIYTISVRNGRQPSEDFFNRCHSLWESLRLSDCGDDVVDVTLVAALLSKEGDSQKYAIYRYHSRKKVEDATWAWFPYPNDADGIEQNNISVSPVEEGLFYALSLNPHQGVVNAPEEVRQAIQKQMLTILKSEVGNEDWNTSIEIIVNVESDVKDKLQAIVERLSQQSNEILTNLSALVDGMSTKIGVPKEYYSPNFSVDNDIDSAIRKAASVKTLNIALEGIVAATLKDLGVRIPAIRTTLKPSAPPTKGRSPSPIELEEQDHSAGALHALALLNLYSWIQALKKYYDDKEKPTIPPLIVLIEEPEVYLHPQWARTFSDSLVELGRNSNIPIQAMASTHSPIFTRLDQHLQLVILYSDSTKRRAYKMYYIDRHLDSELKSQAPKVTKRISQLGQFHPTVNELFFASNVALIEGPTEAWLIPTFARKLWNRTWQPESEEVEDPTHQTTLVPCGPTYMLNILKMLKPLGINPIVIHDLDYDPSIKRYETVATQWQEGIKTRNSNIENFFEANGPQKYLRRFAMNLENVMGYEPKDKAKPYRALLFLLWLFHGDDRDDRHCVNEELLFDVIRDWEGSSDEQKAMRTYKLTSLSLSLDDNDTTKGHNLEYLVDVICQIYTSPMDEERKSEWQKRKAEFFQYLSQDRKIWDEDKKALCLPNSEDSLVVDLLNDEKSEG